MLTHRNIQQLRRITEDARDNHEKAIIRPDMLDRLLDIASQTAGYRDLMDGGVACAAIEAEVIDPERARSLAQERDEALSECDRLRAVITQQNTPRPLTADDITDEMVHRAEEAFMWNDTRGSSAAMAAALAAALAEPPSRPEGAEGIEAALMGVQSFTGVDVSPAEIADLADALAERGVRVTGDQS